MHPPTIFKHFSSLPVNLASGRKHSASAPCQGANVKSRTVFAQDKAVGRGDENANRSKINAIIAAASNL